MGEPTDIRRQSVILTVLQAICLIGAIPTSLYTVFFLFGLWFNATTHAKFATEDDYSFLFVALAQIAAPYFLPLAIIGAIAGLAYLVKGGLNPRWMAVGTILCLGAIGVVIYEWSVTEPIPNGSELYSLAFRVAAFWLAILGLVALAIWKRKARTG